MMNQSHPTAEDLIDYLHRELPPSKDAAIHAHLADCAACSERHETEARIGEMLRAHARSEEREFPIGLRSRILDAALNDRPLSWWERLSATLAMRPAIAVPVAAAAAVAIYFGAHLPHGGPARRATVDAAYYLEDHAALATTVPFGETPAIPAMLTSDDTMADERTVDETR